MKKALPAILLLTVIAALGVVLSSCNRGSDAPAANETDLQSLPPAENPDVIGTLRSPPPPPSSTTGRIEKEPSAMTGMMEAAAEMMKDPAMREFIREQQMAGLDTLYADMFEILQLEPEALQQLKSLLADQKMVGMDEGLTPGTLDDMDKLAEAGRKINAQKEEILSQIRSLLGEDNFAVLEEYEDTQQQRILVRSFSQNLPINVDPLTREQEHDLISAMRKAADDLPLGSYEIQTDDPAKGGFSTEMLENMMRRKSAQNSAYLEQAATLLTPKQLTVFEKNLARDYENLKMNLEMSSKMLGGRSEGTQ